MVAIQDVDATALINKVAEKLVKSIEMPGWASFVKTGAHRERPPLQANWWYIRAAAILRNIYGHGPVGISKLRSKYGGAKNRGRKPHKFTKGSGKVIRTIVQQLEEKGYLKQAEKGKGRLITSLGQSLFEKSASEVYTKRPVKSKVTIKKETPFKKPAKIKKEPKVTAVLKKVKKAAPKKEAKKIEKPKSKKGATKPKKVEKPKSKK